MATKVKTSGAGGTATKAPPKIEEGMSVLDFFNVSTNRMDSWNDLNSAAVKLSHAKTSGRKNKEVEEKVKFQSLNKDQR